MLISGSRKLAATLTLAAVLMGGASPATAFQDEGLTAREKSVPVLLDAFFLRPMGLVLTIGGAALAVVPTAIVAITRPTDIVKPLDALVAGPFRYTFLDPLGEHSPVRNR